MGTLGRSSYDLSSITFAGSEGTMKKNENGGFCVLYVEPTDDKATVLQVINGQKKPVVILLAEQARAFQRPEDFTTLKHIKRQLDVPIVFVIPHSGHLVQLAGRNGFPVYLSMDALADALAAGQVSRSRSLARPAGAPEVKVRPFVPKKTVPLAETITAAPVSPKRTRKLSASELLPAASAAPIEVAPPPAYRKTGPLTGTLPVNSQVKKTEPLAPASRDVTRRRTIPLTASVPQPPLVERKPLPSPVQS